MVSRTEIGILALLGVGALFLFKKASGSSVDFSTEPATPFSILEGQKLQAQFDQLGDVIDEQESVLQKLFKALKLQTAPQQTSLNFANIPTGSLLGISLGAPLRAGSNQQVTNFGKVPSNQASMRPKRGGIASFL